MASKHKLSSDAMKGLRHAGTARAREKARPPARTTAELAEELGLSTQRLSHLLTRDDAPRVSFVRLIGGYERHYFVRSEVLRWYRALTAPRTPTEPPAAAEGGA